MATYIVLGNYTQQGMDKIKGAPARIDTAREVIHQLGAELKHWYLVTGQYDFVMLLEAPNDETVAKLMLAIGSHGNIRTQTSRAFTEDEFRQIVTDLPY